MAKPIDLYYWRTPNGYKISIALEEMGLKYNLHLIDINKGEQFSPSFARISPNNKIPAIHDPKGPGGRPITVFETGAILLYLARKSKKFLPRSERARVEVDEWLMWQMSGLGPILGQFSHFFETAPNRVDDQSKIAYAQKRFMDEANRLFGVLDQRVSNRDYIVDEYSIADMAAFPWVRSGRNMGLDLASYHHLHAWFERIHARPAVQRGLELGAPPRKAEVARVEEPFPVF